MPVLVGLEADWDAAISKGYRSPLVYIGLNQMEVNQVNLGEGGVSDRGYRKDSKDKGPCKGGWEVGHLNYTHMHTGKGDILDSLDQDAAKMGHTSGQAAEVRKL